MEKLFTIGEFAEKSGVTLRTLRYYDKIGLLKPCFVKESGHRLYSIQDFAHLQRILTLKYIGLSLDDIANIIKYDVIDQDFKKSLEIQKKIMNEKVQHMYMVMSSIDETLHMLDKDDILNWDKFVKIINILNMDNRWMEQYENASNLKARIRIHEMFSTNREGWMQWYFKQLNIPENARILELGCGDASFWFNNIDLVPESWSITLTDFSEGMLRDAKNKLGIFKNRFKYQVVDAQDIPFENEKFDVIFANHMLYHVNDIQKVLKEVIRVLSYGGYFYASTVGHNHMKEMREIIKRYDSRDITTVSWDLTEKFQLENGYSQLEELFDCVELKRYPDSLMITKAGPLVDYIFSMPGNAKEILDEVKLNSLISFIEHEISKSSGILITKDTGFFQGRKLERG